MSTNRDGMSRAQREARETLARLVQLMEAIAPVDMVVGFLQSEISSLNNRPHAEQAPPPSQGEC
ncbi:MAG: hypothetical protein KDJ37_08755 [Hyphomicrobiaceae bacterium]|nr:hypothetical protein [Hyphomicrobiaceae bacterium]